MWLPITQLIFYLFTVTMNFLSNYLPFNGQTNGEVSDKLDVPFTPAGYVFSIWGFIYMLLAIWVIRAFFKRYRNHPAYKAAFPWFAISCVLNGSWLLAYQYEYFLLSVLIIVALFFDLLVLYRSIRRTDHGFLDLFPFSIYLGWISVASIANLSYYLTYLGWEEWGLSNTAWTVIMLTIATLLAGVLSIKNKDWAYPLVFAWAFIGIGIRNANPYPTVSILAYTLAGVTLLLAAALLIKQLGNRGLTR